MPGKCVVVCVWRRSQWAEQDANGIRVTVDWMLEDYRCGDSGGDAVF